MRMRAQNGKPPSEFYRRKIIKLFFLSLVLYSLRVFSKCRLYSPADIDPPSCDAASYLKRGERHTLFFSFIFSNNFFVRFVFIFLFYVSVRSAKKSLLWKLRNSAYIRIAPSFFSF